MKSKMIRGNRVLLVGVLLLTMVMVIPMALHALGNLCVWVGNIGHYYAYHDNWPDLTMFAQ